MTWLSQAGVETFRGSFYGRHASIAGSSIDFGMEPDGYLESAVDRFKQSMRSRRPEACPPGSVRHRLGSHQPVHEPLTVDDDSLVQAFVHQAVIVVEPDTELLKRSRLAAAR